MLLVLGFNCNLLNREISLYFADGYERHLASPDGFLWFGKNVLFVLAPRSVPRKPGEMGDPQKDGGLVII